MTKEVFTTHHATFILLKPKSLHLKLQFVIMSPRQEARAGASQLAVKETSEPKEMICSQL